MDYHFKNNLLLNQRLRFSSFDIVRLISAFSIIIISSSINQS